MVGYFNKETEYALAAVAEIARRACVKPCALSEVARRHQISAAYLEQILGRLRRAQILVSRRGRDGGYRLARSPQAITVQQIIEVFGKNRTMKGPGSMVVQKITEKLNGLTVLDLI